MRTTVTIDVEIAQQIKTIARESGKSMRKVINDLLRGGLAGNRQVVGSTPFRLKAFHLGWREGTDPGRLNQLYDQLETEASIKKLAVQVRPSE